MLLQDSCVDAFAKSCGASKFKGDGFCDDNNNGGCDWDGGDCCGSAVKKNYCKVCKCADCEYTQQFCTAACGKPNLYGDKFCDDQNNNCGCGWDGGGASFASVGVCACVRAPGLSLSMAGASGERICGTTTT